MATNAISMEIGLYPLTTALSRFCLKADEFFAVFRVAFGFETSSVRCIFLEYDGSPTLCYSQSMKPTPLGGGVSQIHWVKMQHPSLNSIRPLGK
jgi:hypothetical protein